MSAGYIGLFGFNSFRPGSWGEFEKGIQEKQDRRLDLLLKALEFCPDPEQALTVAVCMEQFVSDGQTSSERPREAMQPGGQLALEVPGKKGNRIRWTAENDAHVRQLWLDKLSVEEIARELKKNTSQYLRTRASFGPFDQPPRPQERKSKKMCANPDKHSLTTHCEKLNGNEVVGRVAYRRLAQMSDFNAIGLTRS